MHVCGNMQVILSFVIVFLLANCTRMGLDPFGSICLVLLMIPELCMTKVALFPHEVDTAHFAEENLVRMIRDVVWTKSCIFRRLEIAVITLVHLPA